MVRMQPARVREFIASLWAIGATRVAGRLLQEWEDYEMPKKDPKTGPLGKMACTLPNGPSLSPQVFLAGMLRELNDRRNNPSVQLAPRAQRRRRARQHPEE